LGQYHRISRCLTRAVEAHNHFSIDTSFDVLVDIKGIGPKTAAFFCLHNNPDFDIPVIDTHVVKYMISKGIEMKVTSSLPKYLANAELVKAEYQKDFPHLTVAQADLEIWKKYSGRT
jgi:thermostable 8-oxoguanine DNA glycosylase